MGRSREVKGEGEEGLKVMTVPECKSIRTVETGIFYLSRLRNTGCRDVRGEE